jgi:transcriptional regulator with XRE-family HTH domain
MIIRRQAYLTIDEGNLMDVASVLKHRLKDLGHEQRELAIQAGVTEGYISQLLSGKKTPPAPRRTDIYPRMERFLDLPDGFLSNVATIELTTGLKTRLGDPPPPLFAGARELILSKCDSGKAHRLRSMFEKEPFGEVERLVTQKLLDVVKGVVNEEQGSEGWIQEVARLSDRTCNQTRIDVHDFLSTDIFNISTGNCISFLEPVIESWDIDLENFAIQVVLNSRVTSEQVRTLEFVEAEPERPFEIEPGLGDFLADSALSGDATDDEIEFIKKLRFKTKRPTAMYFYRELQSLRDPLHFRD